MHGISFRPTCFGARPRTPGWVPVQIELKTERLGMTYRLLFAYAFVRPESEQNSSYPTFPRAPHALKQLIEQRLRGASRPISRSAPTRWREKATRISAFTTPKIVNGLVSPCRALPRIFTTAARGCSNFNNLRKAAAGGWSFCCGPAIWVSNFDQTPTAKERMRVLGRGTRECPCR